MNYFDTVVISDTHLGAKNCAAEKLRAFLRMVRTKRLVLNGDIFDDLNFKRLDGAHFHCLRAIRKLSPKAEVIWISGNHDGAAGVLSHIMGVEVRPSLRLNAGAKTYFVLHGDAFDEIIHNHPVLTAVADFFYRIIQVFDQTQNIALFLKRKCKAFTRSYDKVKHRCIELAKRKGFQGVMVGHLHIPESDVLDGIHYVNSGSWTQSKCTFIGVKGDEVKVYDYDEFYQSVQEENRRSDKIHALKEDYAIA